MVRRGLRYREHAQIIWTGVFQQVYFFGQKRTQLIYQFLAEKLNFLVYAPHAVSVHVYAPLFATTHTLVFFSPIPSPMHIYTVTHNRTQCPHPRLPSQHVGGHVEATTKARLHLATRAPSRRRWRHAATSTTVSAGCRVCVCHGNALFFEGIVMLLYTIHETQVCHYRM